MNRSYDSEALPPIAEIADALLPTREKKGWLSNCYLNRDALKDFAERIAGFGRNDDSACLIIHGGKNDTLALSFAPTCEGLPPVVSTGRPIIVNWPARQSAMTALQAQVTSLLAPEGFRFYAQHKRMKLQGRTAAPEAREGWIFSLSADPREVYALWTGSLNPYVELPSIDQCAALIREGAVLSILDSTGGLVASMLVRKEGVRTTLEHISVRPDHRRNGLGRYLVRQCLSRLPSEARVQLWVDVDNIPATALYDSLGFIDDGLVSCQWLRL